MSPPENDDRRPVRGSGGHVEAGQADAASVAASRDRTHAQHGTAAILDAALSYARRGWPVLPVIGKRPALQNWPTAATTEPATIRSWWERNPRYNVGIVTGERSGIAVVDVDPRNGGTGSLAKVEERIGALPGTVTAVTGSGGVHLLYAHPGTPLKSRANALGRGLDIKGDGGMIVAAPSIHPSGARYYWIGDCWSVPLTPWPAALTPDLPAPPQRRPSSQVTAGQPSQRLKGLVQAVLTTTPGSRNEVLFWASCKGAEMVADGTQEEVVGDALLCAAEVKSRGVVFDG